MSSLTHINRRGEAAMVDISAKAPSHRIAQAGGIIRMQQQTLSLITEGGIDKGDVLAVARVAAIMAAKRTADLIPLCHPLSLDHVTVDFRADSAMVCLLCRAEARLYGATGVEMEALAAVQGALLTVYDMCKAVDREMVIDAVRLLRKSGGRRGEYVSKEAHVFAWD